MQLQFRCRERVTLVDDLPGISTIRPEDLDEFRQARLLLLLAMLTSTRPSVRPDLERLSFYDFFSANPFLLATDEQTTATLSLAGFDATNLSYQSSGQRFANNRARLQFDLAVLTARGLVSLEVRDRRVTYSSTPTGTAVGASLRSMYADSYRRSAAIVFDRLRRMSDAALRREAKSWLRADALMIDLYDPDTIAQ